MPYTSQYGVQRYVLCVQGKSSRHERYDSKPTQPIVRPARLIHAHNTTHPYPPSGYVASTSSPSTTMLGRRLSGSKSRSFSFPCPCPWSSLSAARVLLDHAELSAGVCTSISPSALLCRLAPSRDMPLLLLTLRSCSSRSEMSGTVVSGIGLLRLAFPKDTDRNLLSIPSSAGSPAAMRAARSRSRASARSLCWVVIRARGPPPPLEAGSK